MSVSSLIVMDDFLTPEQCQALIAFAKPRLQVTTTWNLAKGGPAVDPEYRVSESIFCLLNESSLIGWVERKIETVTGIPVAHGEGIQMFHYGVGGFYKPHYDWFDPAFDGNKAALAQGGQRVMSVCIYLNHVAAGGQTQFHQWERIIEPKPGRALFWRNVLPDGTPDRQTMHEALPVVTGEKWVLMKWLRERPYV